ncbi:MAG: glycosyltransferase family 39 protein [Patescibacteria group bacterium]
MNNKNISNTILAWIIAGIILLSMFLIAFFSSSGAFGDPGDSGTVDEIAHIPSGYSYDKYQDFRLNPEHPPLAKALAGIPLTLNNEIKGIKDDWSWNGINQWEAGWYMLYEAGNNPKQVLLMSRIPIMILMLILGLILYLVASRWYGKKVGLIVLAFYAFYPDVIAHGRLVTTDIAAAFGYLITILSFNNAIEKPSLRNIIIAGLSFGVAQLLKFSAFLLYGVLLLLIFVRAWINSRKEYRNNILSYLKIYFWVCFISLILVWLVYIPFVWNTPVSIEHEVIESNLTDDSRTLILRNFLHLFEGNPITRAVGHYLLGIFLVIGRVGGGNATFLMGQVAEKSIPWFFPVAWLIKTPIPIIVLTLASVVSLFFIKKTKEESWKIWLVSIPIIIYWAFTLKGSLNIGIRHLMPTVPFVLLLIGWLVSKIKDKKYLFGIVLVLVAFQMYHTISYYPQYIAYFNNFVPKDQRYKYMVDSSLDWGQDMLRLKKYIDDNGISDIKVDYFGGSVPSYYIPEAREWHSSYGPAAGWLAVSSTFYQSSKLYGEKEGKWSYGWLDQYKPTTEIGGSILVFNISDEQLRDNPPTSPYPITKIDTAISNTANPLFNQQK